MEIDRRLDRPEFPRSQKYDSAWVLDNQMGPNALWLTEWLAERMSFAPGMRVLDLGCGKAMSSIFLAREFDVRVWATDLWMDPDYNWRRVMAAGVSDRVFPIKAEAHNLPYAEGFFDAVISIDAYQYFGSDELYIDYLSRFVRPGGWIGVVVVGLMQPLPAALPEHLTNPQSNGKIFWEPSCRAFKTQEFWHDLWLGSPMLQQVSVEAQENGWRYWRDFENALEIAGKSVFPSDAEALDIDQGRFLGFLRAVGRRTELPSLNFYDPALGQKVGVDQ